MPTTTLPVFDQTLHETNHWLRQIMERMRLGDRHLAYHILRNALQIIRDCLTTEEAAHLSAQLPMLVRGIFYERWRPNRVDHTRFTRGHVFERLAVGLGAYASQISAEDAMSAVLDTVIENIDSEAAQKFVGMFPPILQNLWLTGDA